MQDLPSPRSRPDAILLYRVLPERAALEAFATTDGVEWLRAFPNIVAIAARLYPQLQPLLDQQTPSDLVAIQVGMVLDGIDVAQPIEALDVPLE